MLKQQIIFFILVISWSIVSASESDLFEKSLFQLTSKSFTDKSNALENIVLSGNDKAIILLETLEEGLLYYRKSDKRIVIIKKIETKYELTDIKTDAVLATVKKRKIKKITINNKLRGKIRSLKATINLQNQDPVIRLKAVNDMLDAIDDKSILVLKKLVHSESEANIKSQMQVIIAIEDLLSVDKTTKLNAIKFLKGNLAPVVSTKLEAMLEYENDPELMTAIVDAQDSIKIKLKLSSYAETLFFGISLGSVLVLAAIGLAITFGVMGVINMAHGELIMLGAYTTYVIQQLMPQHIALSLVLAIPAAFMVSAIVGILIERGVIRHLYGRPLETLLATFGISLILQQAVRSIFSPLNRSVITPDWMSGSLVINSALSITINRLVIIIFCLVVFACLYLILKKTRLGLQVRAVTQNRQMAQAMGVKSAWVDAMTFGLGSGIAGVAGVALSQLTNVGPNLGQAYIIDSFMVVVFGGVGNLWGTLVGGLSLGIANKIMEPWSGAVLAKILILIFIILFIQKKPRGLFPQKGRSVEH